MDKQQEFINSLKTKDFKQAFALFFLEQIPLGGMLRHKFTFESPLKSSLLFKVKNIYSSGLAQAICMS